MFADREVGGSKMSSAIVLEAIWKVPALRLPPRSAVRVPTTLREMREVTDATFEQDVLGADRPVVVDFWAPVVRSLPRGRARARAALEDKAAGKVEFAKLNIDQNPVTASRYSVLAIPTAILFADGEPRDTVVGARSPGALRAGLGYVARTG